MKVLGKIKIMSFCLLALLGIGSTENVMKHQFTSDEIRVKNFYRLEKNSLDMVFIGASTTFTDYSAPLAWHEKGITSYSLATNMAPMGLAKSMLKEARKTQKPKLFVIDVNGVLYNDRQESKEGSLRLWIDNMKFSINKLETIKELIPKTKTFSFVFPLMKYHGNWEKLHESIKMTQQQINNMFDKDHLSIAGMEGNSNIDPQTGLIDINYYPNSSQLYNKSGAALKDLLEYCKSNEMDNVIFTNMPRFYNSKNIKERGIILAAGDLIKSYGYQFYDFDYYVNEIGLNPLTDFYNTNHLNIYGQEKFTSFMIETIEKDYDLSSEHSEEIKNHWNKEYEGYQKVYQWVHAKAENGEDFRYNYDEVRDILDSK